MDNNKTTEGIKVSAPTGVFDVNRINADTTAVFPTEHGAHKPVSEKTLRKRLARLCASRSVLALAVLLSLSALLTVFRGYYLPITLLLTVGRVLSAAAVWTLCLTAGKKGGRLLAALPLYVTIARAVALLFGAVFIFCGMFGKMVLLGGSGAVNLVRTVYGAGMWAVIPALACIVAAYCFYLFARHERLLCCNIRDGLTYGFAFEGGATGFLRSSIAAAVAFPVLQVIRGVVGTFGKYELFSDGAAKLLDKLFISQSNYWVNFLGILVHSAALILAGTLAVKYSATVKKYKAQKEARKEAKNAEKKR